MYKYLIRPLLFALSPETAHRVTVGLLRFVGRLPFGRRIMRLTCGVHHKSLEREVLGMHFENPVGVAAGLDKNGTFYKELSSLGFGFVEIGAVTPRAQSGNPRPRLFRLPDDNAIVNRMGFNNDGVEALVRRLKHGHRHTIIGANIGKNTDTPNEEAVDDYLRLFRLLYEYVDYFVVNVSCPNVQNIGALQNGKALREILAPLFEFRCGQNNYRPILVKVSPDLTFEQLDEIIEVLIDTPLDGIEATNTTTSREGLRAPQNQIDFVGRGGLSGRPLHKRAVEVVRYIHTRTEGRYPIIGVGGIMSAADAHEMLDAGADLIQLYTGFIYNGTGLVREICKSLIKR